MRFATRSLLLVTFVFLACGGDEKRPHKDEDGGPSDGGDDGGADSDADTDVDAGPDLALFGQPCTVGADCESGVCIPESLGGTCTEPCAHDADCEPFDYVCLVLPVDEDDAKPPEGFAIACGPGASPGYVVGNYCDEHDDCTSRRCESNVCSAVCVDENDCAFGMSCVDQPVGFVEGTYPGCGFTLLESGSVVEEFDYGTITIGGDGTGSEILGVAVAPDAVSFTVNARQILEDGDDVLGVGFTSVVEPDIDVILDLGALGEGDDQPLRCWPMFEVDAMLVPNSTTDRLTLETGLYSWRTISTRAADGDPWPDIDAEITAYVKRSVDEPTSGTLDLTFTMVDVGFTAADAPSDSRLQSAIDAVGTTLGQAGISIGDVAYYDVSSEDEARLAVIDSTQGVDSELGELFQLSEGRTGYAINVFLVRTIAGSALGVAGGVPGPVKLHGTRHSGVAVEGEDGVLNASQLAQIISHEVGHYLGLFHPTESDPERTYDDDPIADTTYGDSTNLMHWSVNLGSPNTDLTAGQGYVLIRNPAVQ